MTKSVSGAMVDSNKVGIARANKCMSKAKSNVFHKTLLKIEKRNGQMKCSVFSR